jgi:nucleotidyltransferase/DNA polymerase involved in DNA repair
VARWVLHVDLDQFIAAVEVLRHPELRGRPVVVGGDGDPTKRGVVSTASYEAREHGVHSGLPLRTAARRLPDAVFLPVDRAAYEEISETVMEVLRSTGAVVEVLGWDEAFVGVDTEDPEAFGRSLARQVRETTQLDCTVGIGENKLQAKIATGFGKPAGVFRLTFANWFEVLGARPTEALWGIGAKTAKKLAGLGIGTVSDLATADPDALAAVFGPMTGPWLVLLACGRGDAEVDDSPYVARGHGREETFQRNIADWSQVEAEVARIAGLLAVDLASEPRPALRIVVKVRYAPFITETHGVTLAEPSSDPAVIARAAAEALSRFTGRRPVRLLGVRAQFEKGARLEQCWQYRAGNTGLAIPGWLYRALHADLAEGGVGGQRLAFGGDGEPAALVQQAGAGVGLGHPQVDGAGTLLPGPAGDRVDDRLTDAAAPGLRPDEHGDELDHAGGLLEAAGQPGRPGRAGLGDEGDERAVAGGPLVPDGVFESGFPRVGGAEGVRRVPQRLETDVAQRRPVGHRRRTYQDHAPWSRRRHPPDKPFSAAARQPLL